MDTKGSPKRKIISQKEIQMLKKASPAQIYGWAVRIYRQGFEDGLREAEKEYDDPNLYQIIDEDEARRKIGDTAYNVLMDISQ